MKVGILQFFSWPQRRVPLPTVYARALQRIAIMDQTGYDAVWLAEHHFTHYSVCPSVHLMGMTWPARRSISVLVLAFPWRPFTIRCGWPKR